MNDRTSKKKEMEDQKRNCAHKAIAKGNKTKNGQNKIRKSEKKRERS